MGGYQGELRIGAILTVQNSILQATLLKLRVEAPNLDAALVPDLSINLFSQLGVGELDLAILICPPFGLPKELHCTVIVRGLFELIPLLDL